jgi:hypothetical protein
MNLSESDRPYVPEDVGTPLCPICPARLVFEVYPGRDYNEWRSYCPQHGYVDVDAAVFEDL